MHDLLGHWQWFFNRVQVRVAPSQNFYYVETLLVPAWRRLRWFHRKTHLPSVLRTMSFSEFVKRSKPAKHRPSFLIKEETGSKNTMGKCTDKEGTAGPISISSCTSSDMDHDELDRQSSQHKTLSSRDDLGNRYETDLETQNDENRSSRKLKEDSRISDGCPNLYFPADVEEQYYLQARMPSELYGDIDLYSPPISCLGQPGMTGKSQILYLCSLQTYCISYFNRRCDTI